MELKELLEKEYGEILTYYPKLMKPACQEQYWRINGSIDVIDNEGGYWDTYQIAILIPLNYPQGIPILQEVSKKIERDIDWHMVGENGLCCLATPAKIYHDLSGEITLLKWLNRFAHPFLANHVFKKKTGNYANEEFSHGTKGIIEGWEKILNINGNLCVLHYLRQISGYRTQSLNRPCFCGSGKKYKRCYVINPHGHRFCIPPNQIDNDIKSIASYLN